METISSSEIQKNFGRYMDAVGKGPVQITKHGRAHAVLISAEEYGRLAALEDRYWGELARQAEERGDFLSPEERTDFIKNKLRTTGA